MKRRDLLQISAAAAAVPLVAPAQEHAHDGGAASKASARSAAAWKPQVFTPQQNETVVALTEAIIPTTDTPGAKAAKVNQYIDLFLAAGPASERQRFLTGLDWLESYTTRKYQQPFARCTTAQQNEILTILDRGADADTEAGHQFFRMAKQMTSRFYYQTEIGFKELNKGGVPTSFGCQDAQHKTA